MDSKMEEDNALRMLSFINKELEKFDFGISNFSKDLLLSYKHAALGLLFKSKGCDALSSFLGEKTANANKITKEIY